MYGWTRKIALIDLTRQQIRTLSLSPETCAGHIGGRGLGGLFVRPAATRSDPGVSLPEFEARHQLPTQPATLADTI